MASSPPVKLNHIRLDPLPPLSLSWSDVAVDRQEQQADSIQLQCIGQAA